VLFIHPFRAQVRECTWVPRKARSGRGIAPHKGLIGLPQAALELGVHRATVNEMVHDGRVRAIRVGPAWFIDRSDLEALKASYRRPKNSPRPRPSAGAASAWEGAILKLLSDWPEATADELGKVLQLHPGNVRKYLALMKVEGLVSDELGSWRITEAGRDRVGVHRHLDVSDQIS
jgi:excisionase family DNA binding protein